MFKPLEGVKVIDLTYFVAGPGAAKILADWGADVIKVEPSFGDPGRGTGGTMNDPTEKDCNPFYTAYNANKRGLSLNLKAQEGKDILDKLLETADVFITSYRTGALVRLGLDYDTLSKKHPHIIWAQINGFGDFGPAKDNPGFDTVAFWARSGNRFWRCNNKLLIIRRYLRSIVSEAENRQGMQSYGFSVLTGNLE